MKYRSLFFFLTAFLCVQASGQIRNRLGVDDAIFLRYANGRMQQYNPQNILVADSLYRHGVYKNDANIKMLALSLELPVRYSSRDSLRVEEIVKELKILSNTNRKINDFYYLTMYDYCNLLIMDGRISDAMLEARDMSTRASEKKSPSGQMYAYRIIGIIQSYRTNSVLAIRNFERAADFCIQAKEEQELPNIYIFMAQELIRMGRYREAGDYCSLAEEYQDFYPALRVKTAMTRAYLYDAEGSKAAFEESYRKLVSNPLYRVQTDSDTRILMEICRLRSEGRYPSALISADSLISAKKRFEQKHALFALIDDWEDAYDQLLQLMNTKDSIYIVVQNEDMAILDAELNNAQLRYETARMKARQEIAILLGMIFLFVLVSAAIMVSQWNLNMNLDNLRSRNLNSLASRDAYRRALDAKEKENEMRTRILQNNTRI